MRITVFKKRRLLIGIFFLSIALVSLSKLFICPTTHQEDTLLTHLQKRNYEGFVPFNGKKQVVDTMKKLHRKMKGFFSSRKTVLDAGSTYLNQKVQQFSLLQSDLFISLKTTKSNHDSRLKLLLDTWIAQAKNETYIFTDQEHPFPPNFPADQFFRTNCSSSHYRHGLCCKMSKEFDIFISTKRSWFCHVDDDNYLNVPALVKLLQNYNHTEKWYLGRSSISHPIEIQDRLNPGQKLAFWFATGGAGFCISRGLAEAMIPLAGGGRIQTVGDSIRLPDDCTVGYIINHQLKLPLTQIRQFHSHLEPLPGIPSYQLQEQLTLSYSNNNVVDIQGYSKEVDPTRFRSIHCHLYPMLKQCVDLPR